MKDSRYDITRQTQSGVALVLTLWLLALLSVITLGYSKTMKTETRLTVHDVMSAQARSLSQAGIWYGIYKLLDQSATNQIYSGKQFNLEINGQTIAIRIYDESGKIDMNTARPDILKGLVVNSGTNEEEAEVVIQAIEDWRDKDDAPGVVGAESDAYLAAGYGYGPKNGPFNSVGELRLVMGITEPIYRSMAPALTVHSLRRTITPETASAEALLALPDANPESVEQIIVARESEDDQTAGNGTTRSRTFTIIGTGKSGEASYTSKATILLKQNAQYPFSILSWSDSGSAI